MHNYMMLFYPGHNLTISRVSAQINKLLERERDSGAKEGMGSELQWLVCVVNFLLPSARRNSIDSLLSGAGVICITYSPLSLPVASATPSVSVYSVRPGPCWTAPPLCCVDFPVCGRGFNCLGFMLGQAVCDACFLVGLIVTVTFKLLSLPHTHNHRISLYWWGLLDMTYSLASNPKPNHQVDE